MDGTKTLKSGMVIPFKSTKSVIPLQDDSLEQTLENIVLPKQTNKLEEFKKHLIDEEKATNTVESYMSGLKAFFSEYDEINKENLTKFKATQIKEVGSSTVRSRIISLNLYCKFIGHPEYMVKNVKIQQKSSCENVISKEEFARLTNGLLTDGHLMMYWLVRFAAQTGARATELTQMKKDCLKDGEAKVNNKGKLRTIIIPSKLVEESKTYFDTVKGDYLFQNRYGNSIDPKGITKELHRLGEKYGIPKEKLHAHSLRHFFGLNFMENNKDIVLLQNLMGHSKITTTAIYLQKTAEQQRKEVEETVNWG